VAAAQRLLTMEEVSRLTRLSLVTLRYMRSRGDGPPSAKLGRRVFYREAEVVAWVDAQFDDQTPASSAG